MIYKFLCVLLVTCFTLPSWANKTPSHVFQVTEQIVLEVTHLRKNLGVTKVARTPEVQSYKTPLHVFAKSLEVLTKLSKIQQSDGSSALGVHKIPIKKISPSDVFVQAERVLQQVKAIQAQKKTGSSENTAPFVDFKTPSNVYENFWKISFMLDALVKKITPTDVYHNMQAAVADLDDVANHLNVDLSKDLPQTDQSTRPDQVLLQGYLNLHKVASLEKKLGMKPFRVPGYPKGKTSPSDVYDSVSMLVAEIVRVKIHLNVSQSSVAQMSQEKLRPKDVLALMIMTESNINALLTGQQGK